MIGDKYKGNKICVCANVWERDGVMWSDLVCGQVEGVCVQNVCKMGVVAVTKTLNVPEESSTLSQIHFKSQRNALEKLLLVLLVSSKLVFIAI